MKHGMRKVFLFLAAAGLAAVPASAAEGFVEELKAQWESSRRQLVAVAEAVPQDKYNYRPTPEVRTFREIIVHVAGENLSWMEIVGGVPQPGEHTRFEHLTAREDVLQAVTEYFDYGTKVLAGMTDQEAMGTVIQRNRPTPRWVIVVQAIGHSKEHYGNMVTYLRLNGMVPPSSQPRPPQ
jgi:uncharacterized damage-inducible protein DinB